MDEPKIADYALIGNSRSAALTGSNGSIDWCCLPEFDSPSIFAALLDREKGGHFLIAPEKRYQSTQKYLDDTNVVETYFRTEDGEARLLDAFTVMTEQQKKDTLFPDHEIMRILEGVAGNINFKLEFAPRRFYGKYAPLLKDYKKLGVHFCCGENIFILLTSLSTDQLTVENNEKAVAQFRLKAGERIIFSLSYNNQSPAVIPEVKAEGCKRMDNTINFWRGWISKCRYRGIFNEQVRRSALALKLLAHAPTGAILAAPTTSLPEVVAGKRNWDYRYCWLRDASFTTRVLLKLGFKEEVHAYMNWILHATQLTRPKLQVVYSVFGRTSLKEKVLHWLCGYQNSKPVRVGNNADGQFQLDVYGEVLDAVYTYSSLIKEFDADSKKFIIGLGEVICKEWDKPDNGIWEIRSTRKHHTHSKVMAWVGLDRLIKLCEGYKWKNCPINKFKETADRIHTEVDNKGYSSELESYTGELNGSKVDASCLTFPLVNYTEAGSKRMTSTIKRIVEHLSVNNMVYRYTNIDDGVGGAEGSFGICNFWLAENFAKTGRVKKAINIFEKMLKCASPTGLLSEEVDPVTGDLLGNYPQGFTHIGLINAAFAIDEALIK